MQEMLEMKVIQVLALVAPLAVMVNFKALAITLARRATRITSAGQSLQTKISIHYGIMI